MNEELETECVFEGLTVEQQRAIAALMETLNLRKPNTSARRAPFGYCAICAATRPDGMLRIGYTSSRPSHFMRDVRKSEAAAKLTTVLWVKDSPLARAVLSDVGTRTGRWIKLSIDEFATRLKACANRRGIKLYTEDEFATAIEQARQKELAAMDAHRTINQHRRGRSDKMKKRSEKSFDFFALIR